LECGDLQRDCGSAGRGFPHVLLLVARNGQQPRIRTFRYAFERPGRQRPLESGGYGVLRYGEVTIACSHQSDQSRRGGAGNMFCRLTCFDVNHSCVTHVPSTVWVAPGRISTAPQWAGGACRAHSIASSRSETSITMMPPICSFVSAYGPS